MSGQTQAWYSCSLPEDTTLRCAACGHEIDLELPTADHHSRACPTCGMECAFLNWKRRIVQIVIANAPQALAAAVGWAQDHLDELEYVELICALEELASVADAAAAPANAPLQRSAHP